MKTPQTREDANELLRQLAAHEREIRSIDLEMNETIDFAKERAAHRSADPLENKNEIEAALKKYFDRERKNGLKERSIKVLFGTFGMRASSGVKWARGWKQPRVIEKIREIFGSKDPHNFIRTKESVNKETVKAAPLGMRAQLEACGIVFAAKDQFFVEADAQAVIENATMEAAK